jgi:2-iminobutanoate/2-iminopropanoate deaminase
MSRAKETIFTPHAPAAIGPYSQAIKVGGTVYLSGQIGLDPANGQLVEGGFEAQVNQAFTNLQKVATAAGGTLGECVKLTLFLTDLGHFPKVNEIMQGFFSAPFPARSTIGVASLPRGAQFEVEAVMVLGGS